MVRKLFIHTCLFLLPVIILLAGLELMTRAIPSSPKAISLHLEENAQDIEVLILGASQNQAAVNPDFVTAPTLNIASGHQTYNTDYKLLKGLHPRLPKLNTIVIPMSFAHFDTAPNDDSFWKNAAYSYYYDVNTTSKPNHFYNKLLYLSNPDFYSNMIYRYYINGIATTYNGYGYVINNDKSNSFKKVDYSLEKAWDIPLSIRNTENTKNAIKNKNTLDGLLTYCRKNNLKVVVALTPVTKKHYLSRNPVLVKRRDSILNQVRIRYENLTVLDLEQTDDYEVTDFKNHNHLNIRGAKKFCSMLEDALIDHMH